MISTLRQPFVRVAITLFAGVAAPVIASGVDVLVQTTARMVTGDTVATTLHKVDLENGIALPDVYASAGVIPLGSPRLAVNPRYAVFTAGPSRNERISEFANDRSFIELIRFLPFLPHRAVRVPSPYGTTWSLASVVGEKAIVAAETSGITRLLAFNLLEERGDLYAMNEQELSTPFSVSAVAVHAENSVLAAAGLIAETSELGVTLFESSDNGIESVWTTQRRLEGIASPVVTHAAFSGDGSTLFVIVSGYPADRPSGEPTSWCFAFPRTNAAAAPLPVRVEGAPRLDGSSLVSAIGPSCWLATRSVGADHGVATRLIAERGAVTVTAQVPVFGAAAAPIVAPSPDSAGAAIAAGNTLSLWTPESGIVSRRTFDEALAAVDWNAESILVGEGNRFHALNASTLESTLVLPFETGFVTGIVAAPQPKPTDAPAEPQPESPLARRLREHFARLRAREAPEPVVYEERPVLGLRPTVTFHGEALQQELKAIELALPGFEGHEWILEYDREAMPWLGVFPESGTFPETVYLVVYPARYTPQPETFVSGSIRIRSRIPAQFDVDQTIEVRIAPPVNSIPRLLWMGPAGDAERSLASDSGSHRFAELRNLLADAPHYFTHEETWGPSTRNLRDYTVVVLPATVAAEGAVTRQELLDYVAAGGALLLLGGPSDETAASTLSRWLAPLGVEVVQAALAGAHFTAQAQGTAPHEIARHEIARHWSDVPISEGSAYRVANPDHRLVTGPNEATILAQIPYGLGRIALLGTATPLENSAMIQEVRRRFASDLFEWLARARRDINDLDQDGLQDNIEDRNQNGVLDAGETDPRRADTDGDNVRDDLEDLNRNGIVDEGETSPFDPDTDGDGVFDGADASPVPRAGTIHLARVELDGREGPAIGPAEGGGRVLLTGRNFDPDVDVYFGPLPSPRVRYVDSTRLIATVPPSLNPLGETVSVRVFRESDGESSEAADSFVYRAQTEARLRWDARAPAVAENRMYRGTLNLSLALSSDVGVGEIVLLVEVSPSNALDAFRLEPDENLLRTGRRISQRRIRGNLWRIEISPPQRQSTVSEIGTIVWATTNGFDAPLFRSTIDSIEVKAYNGLPLHTEAPEALTVHLRNAIPRATP